VNTEKPREGFMLTGSGVEVYDVKAHIQRAFEDMPIGKYLRPREIQVAGRRPLIRESNFVGLDVIKQRLRGALHGEPIEGIVVDYDTDGKLIAYRKALASSTGAFNDPTVECCGRDAADCDCHPLQIMMAETRKRLNEKVGSLVADQIVNRARELAIALIASPGFTTDETDIHGVALGDTVQTLFTLGFMREPDLMSHHEEALLNKQD